MRRHRRQTACDPARKRPRHGFWNLSSLIDSTKRKQCRASWLSPSVETCSTMSSRTYLKRWHANETTRNEKRVSEKEVKGKKMMMEEGGWKHVHKEGSKLCLLDCCCVTYWWVVSSLLAVGFRGLSSRRPSWTEGRWFPEWPSHPTRTVRKIPAKLKTQAYRN